MKTSVLFSAVELDVLVEVKVKLKLKDISKYVTFFTAVVKITGIT